MLPQRIWRCNPRREPLLASLPALFVVVALSGCNRIQPAMEVKVGYQPILAAAFSPDASRLVVGTGPTSRPDKGEVCVIDPASGQLAKALLPAPVRCLAICPDNSGVWVGCGFIESDAVPDRSNDTYRVHAIGGRLVLLDLKTL